MRGLEARSATGKQDSVGRGQSSTFKSSATRAIVPTAMLQHSRESRNTRALTKKVRAGSSFQLGPGLVLADEMRVTCLYRYNGNVNYVGETNIRVLVSCRRLQRVSIET